MPRRSKRSIAQKQSWLKRRQTNSEAAGILRLMRPEQLDIHTQFDHHVDMKRRLSEEGYDPPPPMAEKLFTSEIQRMISQEVQPAIEQSDNTMKALMKRIQEVDSEPRYDTRIKKLEAHVKKVKRRGDMVFSYIRKHGNVELLQNNQTAIASDSVSPSGSQILNVAAENLFSSSNGGGSGDNVSSSAALLDISEAGTIRKPKEGFWQSLRSKKQVVDLTEESEGRRQNGICHTDASPTAQSSQQWKQEMKPSQLDELAYSVVERSDKPPDLEAQAILQSRLQPFPDTPFPHLLPAVAATKSMPQKPVVKLVLTENPQGIALLWNVEEEDPHAATMECYYIYVAQQLSDGSFTKWKSMGVIQAAPLPMACRVSYPNGGRTLCFIIIGKDVYGRYGPYSDVHTIWTGST